MLATLPPEPGTGQLPQLLDYHQWWLTFIPFQRDPLSLRTTRTGPNISHRRSFERKCLWIEQRLFPNLKHAQTQLSIKPQVFRSRLIDRHPPVLEHTKIQELTQHTLTSSLGSHRIT